MYLFLHSLHDGRLKGAFRKVSSPGRWATLQSRRLLIYFSWLAKTSYGPWPWHPKNGQSWGKVGWILPDPWSENGGRGEREREEVTENDHQKSYREWWRPRGWAYGMLLELFICLCHCTEVFLLGAGTLGVSSPFHDPLILSWESPSVRRPNGL